MNDLYLHLENQWSRVLLQQYNYAVALSGGVDSIVLLHLLYRFKQQYNINLQAVHINHGISSNANYWEQFCQKYCDQYDIPLTIKKTLIKKTGGDSLENAARIFRYQVFVAMSNVDVILLAHHQDDQVETLLSQILRGSALANIAGMRALINKAGKLFYRPLLTVSRELILQYAQKQQLQYITDESNHDNSYLRNFVRNQVLPLLASFDQTVTTKILNLASNLQQNLQLTDEIAAEDLAAIQDSDTSSKSGSIIIAVDKLKRLSNNRQFNVIAVFILKCNLPLPSNKQLQEFVRQVAVSAWDKKPQCILSTNAKIIKAKNYVFIKYTTHN